MLPTGAHTPVLTQGAWYDAVNSQQCWASRSRWRRLGPAQQQPRFLSLGASECASRAFPVSTHRLLPRTGSSESPQAPSARCGSPEAAGSHCAQGVGDSGRSSPALGGTETEFPSWSTMTLGVPDNCRLSGKSYLVLKFLEHQRVWFFQDLLVEPRLALHVDL